MWYIGFWWGYEGYWNEYLLEGVRRIFREVRGIFGRGLEQLQIESHHFHSLFIRKRSAPARLKVCDAVVAK